MAWGQQLYFAADDGRSGVELWTSDGRRAGTHRVADIHPGPGHGVPAHLTVAAGALLFAATDGQSPVRLWRSDGTAAGTRPAAGPMTGTLGDPLAAQPADAARRRAVPGGEVPNRLQADGPRLLYAAMDDAAGYEPWVSDGSAEGTRRLADLAPGPADSFPHQFTRLGERLFFVADDAQGQTALWCEQADGRIQRVSLPMATGAAAAATPDAPPLKPGA